MLDIKKCEISLNYSSSKLPWQSHCSRTWMNKIQCTAIKKKNKVFINDKDFVNRKFQEIIWHISRYIRVCEYKSFDSMEELTKLTKSKYFLCFRQDFMTKNKSQKSLPFVSLSMLWMIHIRDVLSLLLKHSGQGSNLWGVWDNEEREHAQRACSCDEM